MTHDKLLIKLLVMDANESEQTRLSKTTQALRVIVELHKPIPSEYFAYKNLMGCNVCDMAYPCKTIEIIENELS